MFIKNETVQHGYESKGPQPDYLEEGTGPPVILVHSSMGGARQWGSLMPLLGGRWTVRAVNLFGYGGTPAWQDAAPPTLDDYAALVAAIVPPSAAPVVLVGHSLGGAVAMRAAQRLRGRVDRLVLLEPSLFGLLDAYGRPEAFHEILALAARTTALVRAGETDAAGEAFVDYWCGAGAWRVSPAGRRNAIARLLPGLPGEWNAVLGKAPGLGDLRAFLPSRTLLVSFAGTTRPSRQVVEILADGCLHWDVVTIGEGGHMAPLTHPQRVNPMIQAFLAAS